MNIKEIEGFRLLGALLLVAYEHENIIINFKP